MEPTIRWFYKGKDRLFESILDISLTNEAFYNNLIHAADALHDQSLPTATGLVLMPLQGQTAVTLAISKNFAYAVVHEKADQIPIWTFPKPNIQKSASLPLDLVSGTTNRFLTRMVAAVFLQFYETHHPFWVEKYNRDPGTWPHLLRFCRVVRNAISHRMTINWSSPNVASVSWNNLTYSHNDDGRSIFRIDLVSADLIMLLIDFGDKLDEIGCPKLFSD